MKALFSIFSLTAQFLSQFAASGDNFKASLSTLLIVRPQLANGEFVCVCPFAVPARKNSQIWSQGGEIWSQGEKHNGAGVRLPPPRPVIKEFHRSGKYLFSPPGGENIGEILSPISNHRTLRQPLQPRTRICTEHWRGRKGVEEEGEGGMSQNYPKLQMRWQKNRCGLGCPLNGLLSVRLTLG